MITGNTLRRLALSILAAALLPGAMAQAEEAGGTLKRIRDRGAIYLGYRENALPFSYLDEGMNVRGYSWEVCERVAEAVKVRLGLADLTVQPVPVTPNNRIPNIRAGAIDLECGATANNASRQRQVAFAYTTYVAGVKVMVAKDSPIRTIADLDGRRVVTTQGSGAERYVKTAAALRGANVSFVGGASHADSMHLLESGKADAFVLDDALLAVQRAAAADPARFRMLDENLAIEAYAIMLGRDDAEFRQVVNEALAGLMQSGELARIYDKWFMSPIAPNGINLRLPMSDMLKEVLRSPSDRAG